MISLDETFAKSRGVFRAELEHPHVNGLTEIVGHRVRRTAIQQYMGSSISHAKNNVKIKKE